MTRLDPYYRITWTSAAEPEDGLDRLLGAATSVQADGSGPLPRELAQALDAWSRGLPLAARAAMAYRHARRWPGVVRARRN